MPETPAKAPPRDRILVAARAEFSRHGIAGARIDRIAKAASTSKERVYAYFSSKQALYESVNQHELASALDASTLDPSDLPTYVGQLFDYYAANPEHLRMIGWGRLEAGEGAQLTEDPFVGAIVRRKLDQLAQGQAAGHLDASWEPVEIMALVVQLSIAWLTSPELHGLGADAGRPDLLARRRQMTVEATQRLFPAAVKR